MSSIYIKPMVILFFFNDTATTEIYTLSLHDALPICVQSAFVRWLSSLPARPNADAVLAAISATLARSEEHTSELQSQSNLVCRLLLEKKNKLTSRSAHPTVVLRVILHTSPPAVL